MVRAPSLPSLPVLVRARIVEVTPSPSLERVGEVGEEWVHERRSEVVVRRVQGGRWGPNPLLEGRRERPHSVELGGLRGRWGAGARGGGRGWWGVVPCARVRHRGCDEPPEEFARAGIGACFRGGFGLLLFATFLHNNIMYIMYIMYMYIGHIGHKLYKEAPLVDPSALGPWLGCFYT